MNAVERRKRQVVNYAARPLERAPRTPREPAQMARERGWILADDAPEIGYSIVQVVQHLDVRALPLEEDAGHPAERLDVTALLPVADDAEYPSPDRLVPGLPAAPCE